MRSPKATLGVRGGVRVPVQPHEGWVAVQVGQGLQLPEGGACLPSPWIRTSPPQVSGAELGLTWDLLLHTDALDLFVALSTDTAVTALGVLALLVLSWTHRHLTLVHVLTEAKERSEP